jgi:hypothetical protein
MDDSNIDSETRAYHPGGAEPFDDREWSEGPAPFGVAVTPSDMAPQSRWGSSDLWLRRRFTCDLPLPLPRELQASLVVLVVHDDDAEVYLNGAELTRRSGHTNRYTRSLLSGTGPCGKAKTSSRSIATTPRFWASSTSSSP